MFFKHYAQSIIKALPANRLLALDVFRGLTIAAMVLVNNPGSWSYVYAPMNHAKWHGWTPTDLIFPFFVFIVGVSIAIVMTRELRKGTHKLTLLKTALTRAVKLFGLGLFLALFYFNVFDPNYSWLQQQLYGIRVMGVLQRLALVFFLTVFIVLYFKNAGRMLWMIGLLLGYWLALLFIPYVTSDGQVYIGVLEHGNSLTAWLDDYVIGANHLYYGAALPFAFDPEGLLSTLPAVSGCLIGVFTGQLLISRKKQLVTKAKILCFTGVGFIILGELWGNYFPINKALWTSSFVIMSSGWALFLLGFLTWLLDIKGQKLWSAPFVVFGANAIFFYMFSSVLARLLIMIPVAENSLHHWLFTEIYQAMFGNYIGSLAFAMMFLLISYIVTHWLFKKQIFFKV